MKTTTVKNVSNSVGISTEVKTLLPTKITGKSIIKRMETAQILADKFEKISSKYDSLTNFMAGKDLEECQMKFVSQNGYSFTLNNVAIISDILEIVEKRFSEHLTKAENELVSFKL